MSGYLEVKYPFKSNLGLNPFKSWKRHWCILRPNPTFSGGVLAVYCSEAGASAGTVELPSGFVVRRAKSRSRPHAFAVFPADEPRKPRVLLAASSLQEAHVWMDKISALINGNKVLDAESSLKNTYSVTVNITELSRKCGLSGADCTITVSATGVLLSCTQKPGVFIEWKQVDDAVLSAEELDASCVLTVNGEFQYGAGSLRLCSPAARGLSAAVRRALSGRGALPASARKLSKSEGDLHTAYSHQHLGDVRRRSWYSGPSEVSLDDLDLVMSKEYKRIPEGQLSRCAAAGHLAPPAANDSMCERRSIVSVASGIYEEIAETPGEDVYCTMSRDARALAKCKDMELPLRDEPMYECVAECVYGTMRRARRAPPPLPPRTLDSAAKSNVGWQTGVTRHSSLGSLARPHAAAPPAARTLPRWDRSRQAFSAFRKRLKSDSRTAISPKSETTKEKDVQTKKKKFDFTPTRDIFKSFKVSRKMKDLKITSNLGKGETKSCEFLDGTEHVVTTNRCSKSVECLEGNDEYLDGFDADLSIEFDDDTVAALSLPQEIVQLILNSHEKMSIRLKDDTEGDYMPMSPIVPVPAEHHYIVMSPRSNIA